MKPEVVLEPNEKVVVEVKQHKGFLVLVALFIPALVFELGTSINNLGSPNEPNVFAGCGACCLSWLLLLFIFSIPFYLAKRPELLVTDKKIAGFNVGNTKEGLVTEIKKVTIQELVNIGNINFGNLIVQFNGKPTMWLGGLPEPIAFGEKLKSIGISSDKIKIYYLQKWIMLGLLAFYGLVLFVIFVVLSYR